MTRDNAYAYVYWDAGQPAPTDYPAYTYTETIGGTERIVAALDRDNAEQFIADTNARDTDIRLHWETDTIVMTQREDGHRTEYRPGLDGRWHLRALPWCATYFNGDAVL